MGDEIATRWMVIRPGDAPLDIIDGKLAPTPSLGALHAVIDPVLDGGHLEHVSVLASFDTGAELVPLDMFVDEEGHQNGLARNERATAIYRNATLLGRSGAPIPDDPEELPHIVGPAVLFDRKVWR